MKTKTIPSWGILSDPEGNDEGGGSTQIPSRGHGFTAGRPFCRTRALVQQQQQIEAE